MFHDPFRLLQKEGSSALVIKHLMGFYPEEDAFWLHTFLWLGSHAEREDNFVQGSSHTSPRILSYIYMRFCLLAESSLK